MTESIGTRITELCSGLIRFYLSEAEVVDYPYAVYEQTVQEFRTKDGVYKYTADCFINVYSRDPDEAEAKAQAICAALEAGSDDQYVIRKQSKATTCDDNVWRVELNYYVKQTS